MKEWINPNYVAAVRIDSTRFTTAGIDTLAHDVESHIVTVDASNMQHIQTFNTLAEAEEYYNMMVDSAKEIKEEIQTIDDWGTKLGETMIQGQKDMLNERDGTYQDMAKLNKYLHDTHNDRLKDFKGTVCEAAIGLLKEAKWIEK